MRSLVKLQSYVRNIISQRGTPKISKSQLTAIRPFVRKLEFLTSKVRRMFRRIPQDLNATQRVSYNKINRERSCVFFTDTLPPCVFGTSRTTSRDPRERHNATTWRLLFAYQRKCCLSSPHDVEPGSRNYQ